jgi:hypothetical protein
LKRNSRELREPGNNDNKRWHLLGALRWLLKTCKPNLLQLIANNKMKPQLKLMTQQKRELNSSVKIGVNMFIRILEAILSLLKRRKIKNKLQ